MCVAVASQPGGVSEKHVNGRGGCFSCLLLLGRQAQAPQRHSLLLRCQLLRLSQLMIRARAAAFFDDDENDRAPAPTWIMGIPYTGMKRL